MGTYTRRIPQRGMTTGVEERETRQRVTKRARTRAHTHSHAPTPLAQGGKHAGAHIVYIAVVLHKSQQRRSACRASANDDKPRRKRRGESGRARTWRAYTRRIG